MKYATEAVLALVLLLACGAVAAVDPEALGRQGVRQMAHAELRSLERSSGLVDAPSPLPVFVQQEGGPLWVTEVLTDAVDRSPWLQPDPASHHRLQAEVVSVRDSWAFRLSLWRQGWTLRNAAPQRVVLAPWVPTASAIVGAIVALAATRLGLGLFFGGLLAQVLAWALPAVSVPAHGFGGRPGWHDGPFAQLVTASARMLPEASTTVGFGVITACLVLVVLDHRRSRGRGGARLGWGLLGVLGTIAWLEAGGRAGLFAYATTVTGIFGLLGLAGLWTWVGGSVLRGWGR